MKGDPNTGLTAEEFQSLHDVAGGLIQPIPKAHEAHLIEIGYIAPKLGGLQITDAGKMRLAKGR
jgi:hypothetical protein